MNLLQKFNNISKIGFLDMISETDKEYLISLEKEYNDYFVKYSQILDKAEAFEEEIQKTRVIDNSLVSKKGYNYLNRLHSPQYVSIYNIENNIEKLNKYYLSAINAVIKEYAEIEINDIICSKRQPLFFKDLYDHVVNVLNGKTFAEFTKEKAISKFIRDTFIYKDTSVSKNVLTIKSINVETRYSINQHFGYKGKEDFFNILTILSYFENGVLEDISGLVFEDTEFEANKLYPILFQHANELKIDKRGKISIYFTDYEKALNFHNYIYANIRKQ